jgi:alpha-tubulin suppressor-like RCC1 family protein
MYPFLYLRARYLLLIVVVAAGAGCLEPFDETCTGQEDCFRGEVCRDGRCVSEGTVEAEDIDDGGPTDTEPADTSDAPMDTRDDVSEPDVEPADTEPPPDVSPPEDVEEDTSPDTGEPDATQCPGGDVCTSCPDPYEQVELSCDSQDNDCDGQVDESFLQATSISAGYRHTCACSSGETYCWGERKNGKLSDVSEQADAATPNLVGHTRQPHPCRLVAAGAEHTCTANSDGVYCWGSNTKGQVTGANSMNDQYASPQKLEFDGGLDVGANATELEAGDHFTCVLSSGDVFCWGSNQYSQLTSNCRETHCGPTSPDIRPNQTTQVEDLAVGGRHVCVVIEGGDVYCWGDNRSWQLGDEPTSGGGSTGSVVDFGNASPRMTTITAGDAHTCAVDTSGHQYCWGSNTESQVGKSDTEETSRPTLNIRDFSEIEAGAHHNCGLRAQDHELRCWGSNAEGQLGQGPTPEKVINATAPDGELEVTEVAGGGTHTCAILRGDNRVRCWGDDTHGQLGNVGEGTSVAGADEAAVACGE